MPFRDCPSGCYSAGILRQNAIWTAAHVTATLEASSELIDRFVVALYYWSTLATSAQPEITTLIEANGFAEVVQTQEYRLAPHGDEMRAHG